MWEHSHEDETVLYVDFEKKCFFGCGKKNFTLTKFGWSADSGNDALAFETAAPNASAKAVWFGVLTFQSLTFFEFDLIVAKFLYCGRGIPSILHLKVVLCVF